MNILAIETSCDDTSCAVLTDNHKLLSMNINSQNDIHSQFGGVVPEIASRQHLKILPHIYKKTLLEAGLTINDIDGICVTTGPGLVGSLLVGIMFAKGLCLSTKKPFLTVNHIEGHFFASFLSEKKPDFPFVALVASGGHTAIYIVKGFRNYQLIGQTRDDAAGEAFDKVAKILELGYPGGVAIESIAGDFEGTIQLPYPLEKENDFSFSGLKTAVLTLIKKQKNLTYDFKKDLAASFQKVVIDILIDKTIKTAKKYGIKHIVICGGVASNKLLREKIIKFTIDENLQIFIPEKKFCTDNAGMISVVGEYLLKNGIYSDLSISAMPDWSI